MMHSPVSVPLLVAIALMAGRDASAQSIPDLLEQGVYAEETLGDLDAAIAIYERILAAGEQNRTSAAHAQYRLGICHMKKGQEREAILAFRGLIIRFPHQDEPVTQARIQLAALGQSVSAPVTRQVWVPALDTMGRASPDGRYVSYVNWSNGNLAVHDTETGENRDLTRDGTWEKPQAFCDVSIWSPDSRQVAYFWIDRGAGSDLRVVGLDGSEPRVLFSGSSTPDFPPWPRDWSADGKEILALYGKKDESLPRGLEGRIVLVSVMDGSLRVLKSLGGQFTQYASLSPDGRYMVFELEPERGSGKRDIHILATDGSCETPLVEHPADDGAPFWAPDGRRIVFQSNRSGSIGLWLLDVQDGMPAGEPVLLREITSRFKPMGFTPDGSFYSSVTLPALDVFVAEIDFDAGQLRASPTKRSLRFEGTNHAPSWSPDGDRLAYASRRGLEESYVLVIQEIESGEERELAPESLRMFGSNADLGPQWSADGVSILVAGGTRRALDLCLVDVETGEATTIVPGWLTVDEEGSPRRSPLLSNDRKKVYWVQDNRAIVVHDLETRQERELYRTDGYVDRLACSSDGQRLAFFEAAELLQPTMVKTVSTSGDEPTELLSLIEGKRFPSAVGISWTPDGDHLIVGAPRNPEGPDELWMIPASGGEPRRLNLGLRVDHISLHSDGRRICFAAGEDRGEVWAMENILPQLAVAR